MAAGGRAAPVSVDPPWFAAIKTTRRQPKPGFAYAARAQLVQHSHLDFDLGLGQSLLTKK